jgi:hypothetical protein
MLFAGWVAMLFAKASGHLIDGMSECLEAHGCAGKAMASSRYFLQRPQVQS